MNCLTRLRHHLAALARRKQIDLQYLPPMNALRAARALPPLAHAGDQSKRAALTLAFTAEPFEYPRSDWHPSVRFVGPGLWDAPAAAPPTWHVALEEDDRPLLLICGSSTLSGEERLIGAALTAFADAPVRVVATLPVGRLPATVPGNARVERYAPHTALLPHVACVICHAGFGITQKALAAGVPVVACPGARDQFEIARRVEVAQAGVYLPRDDIAPARLRSAVEAALARKPGAERVATAFRMAGGAAAAASAVEAILLSGGAIPQEGGTTRP
jgi:MGT family glycosyltransferase